jgi:hypothetical protein
VKPALLLALALAAPGVAAAAGSRVALVCEAVYAPARETWVRKVEIAYDDRRVSAVGIDGVPVHSFAVEGTLILTALDNERIQIDVAQLSWQSDFRGLARAQGRCERAP